MQWHEQIVVDRRAAAWRGFRKLAALAVVVLVGGFFFVQWLAAASASGALREMVAGRVAGATASELFAARQAGQGLPASSPIGDPVEVLPGEVRTATGDFWDVVPSDLPARMGFEVRLLVDGDAPWIMLVRNTDRGGGLDAPKAWQCRRIDDRGVTPCDPTNFAPDDATHGWELTAVR